MAVRGQENREAAASWIDVPHHDTLRLSIAGRALERLLRLAASAASPLRPICDALLVQRRTYRAIGYKPNLRNPRTFNEKIAWRMLYDRNPLIPLTMDKVSVRNYVAAKVGSDVLVPLIGVYERSADIPWEELPNQFALKASHGSAMNLLVRDKKKIDRAAVLREADVWLKTNYYEHNREWGYRDIHPRLIIEELLLDENGEIPVDFKFHVFGGQAAVLQVHTGRFKEHRMNTYNASFNLMPFRQSFPIDETYVLPPQVREIARTAERIAEDFDYARIDMYLIGGMQKFGEITHYDGAALNPFIPREYDLILGDMWHLPKFSPRSDAVRLQGI